MRRFALLPILLAFAACGDDKPGSDTTDTTDTVQPDTAAPDTVDPDTTDPDTVDPDTSDPDVTPSLTGCLIEPNALLTPPGDTLPCELIPPGLTL